jgi:hypothetical protein
MRYNGPAALSFILSLSDFVRGKGGVNVDSA